MLRKLLFLQESNQIEGIEFPYEEYELAYKTARGNRYVVNSTLALHHIEFSKLKQISFSDLLKVHGILMDSIQEDAGCFRNCFVRVGTHIPPAPSVIYYHLDDWIREFNNPKSELLDTHYWFEHIHPFSDGNGRTGRLLWAWHNLMRGKQISPILNKYKGQDFYEKRQAYYQALRRYHDNYEVRR